MADHASVEKTVTEAMLLAGEITIGAAEQARLGFPDHSDAFDVIAADETLPVVWTAGRRTLTGEALLDFLQDTARVGDVVRIERRDGALSLVVQAPLRGFNAAARPTPPQASPRTQPTVTKAATRARRVASRGERYRLRQRDEYVWHDGVGFLKSANAHLTNALRSRGWDPRDAVEIRLMGEELATLDQFEELLALDAAHIEHMPHQEAAARTVLTRLGGRAVLADEVGLGKTVEAGLVIKELLLRGLADRILIVCPAPLREQWRDELKTKFDEEFEIVTSGGSESFGHNRLIMTLQLALRNAHRLTEPYDLVVIDEAHRLTGTGARRSREVFGELLATAPRALLLTATPVQNNLLELYRLVELLRPGTFRSQQDFMSRYVDAKDPRRPVNTAELRGLVRSVIVRTTREQAGVDRVQRMPPRDQGVILTPPERQLYDLIVDTLRHRMTAQGDHMRRRNLALRLTASPQAISRSALRMAEQHPDKKLRKVLADIGHLAADIRHTAREQAALDVVRQWLDEHGRVIVFTQHTETLLGIQRLLDEAGIASVPFHGSMAHSARSKSIADFRSGVARVLISTDAGAEGQNLQVSNCVVNYDLPWNPMRVEQRIGRVHRLKQDRNVYIANLFARDTIDEHVYRLLHDKLAMFELLFGQVVTVLGELDGKQESTMEGRILEALYEGSDAQMRKRLDALGQELEQARGRAVQMMTTGSDLNQFLAEKAQERRARAAAPQARELLPDAAKKPRKRQRDVEWFVREFLGRAGATLDSPSEGFTVVSLTPELSAAFNDREHLYLAFTHAALDAHPEAELCVVGSEVFDEIMHALRERGDLTGTVARIPTTDLRPRIAHVPHVNLVEQRLEPTPDWSARATYRVQEGVATGNQYIATVDVGDVPQPGRRRDEIPDGAPLPADLTETAVLAAVTERAATRLREDLAQARAEELARQRSAQASVAANLRRQLSELEAQSRRGAVTVDEYRQQRRRLQRAIDASANAAATAQTELRAELLTLELHGSDKFVVIERWQHEAGPTVTIRYPWAGPNTKPRLRCRASGQPIETLAVCADAHVVDSTAVGRCAVCQQDRCAACGPAMVVACLACGADVCGVCRENGQYCPDCRNPSRAPELDRPGEVGWRLGHGATLLVGIHHAALTAANGDQTLIVDDESRHRLRALAARLGLCASTGLVNGPPTPTDEELTDGALWHNVERSVWWTAVLNGNTDIDADAAQNLPDIPAPPALSQRDSRLDELVSRLRGQEARPVTPALVAMPFVVVQRIDSENGELVYREHWFTGTDGATLTAHEHAQLRVSHHRPVGHGRAVAAGSAGPVQIRVDRLNRSYLLWTDPPVANAQRRLGQRTPARGGVPKERSISEAILVGSPGVSAKAESTLAAMVAKLGLPPDHAVVRHTWPGINLDELIGATAAPGTTVSRSASVVWALTADAEGTDIVELPEQLDSRDDAAALVVHDEALRNRLGELSRPPTMLALAPCLSVDETWSSAHGTVTRTYLVAPSAPIDPALLDGRVLVRPGAPLDPRADDATTGRPLAVDSSGHLHDPSSAVGCASCARRFGQCCAHEMKISDCPECLRPACVECRMADGTEVPIVACERCDDRSCQACSHRLTVVPCGLCGRRVCPSCLTSDGTCTTCSSLQDASQEEIAALPAALTATGLDVLIGHDDRSTVAVLIGSNRCEVAVVSDGEVHRWESATREADTLRAQITLGRRSGAGDVAIAAVDIPRVPLPNGALRLRRQTQLELLWEATKGGEPFLGNVRGLPPGRVRRPKAAEASDLLRELGVDESIEPFPAIAETSYHRLMQLRRGRGPYSAAVTVTLSHHEAEDIICIDERGLCRLRSRGTGFDESIAPWHAPVGPLPWVTQGWDPEPELLAMSTIDDVVAVIVAIGRHARLATRIGDEPAVWHIISENRNDLLSASIGRALLGRPALVSVTAMASAARLKHPAIVDGRLERTATTPVAEIMPHDDDRRPLPSAEVARQLGVDSVTTPDARDDLSSRTAKSLRRLIDDHRSEPTHVRIGLRVRDTWRLPDDTSLTVEFVVRSDETTGHLVDQVTGRSLTVAHACRSQHITERVDVCASCGQHTCGACEDGVRRCRVCAADTCRRCGATDTHCGACVRLRRLGRLGRIFNRVGRADEVWHGKHAGVEVTVRRVGNDWSVERIAPTGRRITALPPDQPDAIQSLLPG